MNRSIILIAMLAVVICAPAHAYKVLIKNATGKPLRVNLGATGKGGSYHIGMDANGLAQNAVIEVAGSPKWISAYTYNSSWKNMDNEQTIQEKINIDGNGCSADRHITVYNDKITCDKGNLVSEANDGYHIIKSFRLADGIMHPNGVSYAGSFYKDASGNDW